MILGPLYIYPYLWFDMIVTRNYLKYAVKTFHHTFVLSIYVYINLRIKIKSETSFESKNPYNHELPIN